jgi:hypothetical protein
MLPCEIQTRRVLISVDSLFHSGKEGDSSFEKRNFIKLVPFALEKLYRGDWSILFYSLAGVKDYSILVSILQRFELWLFADCAEDKPLIFSSVESSSPEVLMLSLLERHFSAQLDNEKVSLSVILSDPLLGKVIHNYSRGRLSVHLSPAVWVNITALELSILDSYLLTPDEKVRNESSISGGTGDLCGERGNLFPS